MSICSWSTPNPENDFVDSAAPAAVGVVWDDTEIEPTPEVIPACLPHVEEVVSTLRPEEHSIGLLAVARPWTP